MAECQGTVGVFQSMCASDPDHGVLRRQYISNHGAGLTTSIRFV